MDDEVDKFKKAERIKTGYERTENGKIYYYCTSAEGINGFTETSHGFEGDLFKAGNYYTDKKVAENNARADTLIRRLRQWQALNDEPVNWSGTVNKYTIGYDYDSSLLFCNPAKSFRRLGGIYFSSETKVSKVMKIFKDDLIWFFTEYKQRADG